jgi:pimeloyl-ACP methyl ester carboxylesterase
MSKYFVPTARPAGVRAARRAGAGYGETAQPDWRAVDWPRHLRRASVDGTEINYVDIGSGPGEPVVFVHGLGGQWQNWLQNIPRLARERRVVALDLPGFGLSPLPPHEITITRYARYVNALCEHLGLDRVELVGNSMGGYIAAEVAIQFPERVDRLALVSAAGITSASLDHRPVLTLGRIATAIVTWTAARNRELAARRVWRHLSLLFVARHPSLLKPDFAYEAFFKGTGKPGFLDALRACLDYDFRDRLPEIRRPTLIIWGEQDSIIPVKDAHEFERLIPDSRKVVMRETGHIAMAERPSAFNDLLIDFLAETGPASALERFEGESQVA